ncbi:MAG: catechol 2,3-dioxygenase-like lactoylglutathione lyase family enzyme [Paraglaciecola sp.]|jgi:catechol 2,3-dioxygenase-like lactoylglutathione lyase family enzyme
MHTTMLEHINITVSDADKTAALFCHLFGWHVRWAGPAKDDGYTVHVGNSDCYLALYTATKQLQRAGSYKNIGHLNHIGILVSDLDSVEQQILQLGYNTFNHADYEPGRRFYFMLRDNIEIEVISYQ